MKHVKLYEAFSTSTFLTEEQIEWLNSCTEGTWKLNPSTGLVDVNGDFDCVQQNLTDFKGVAFGHVSGYFYCDNNQLTSLEGAPQKVNGNFGCSSNLLTSLKGAPQTVNGDFWCDGNQLTSLEGVPKSVDGDFNCADNPVSESTLDAIFALMKSGMGYQQALEEHWPEMGDEDRGLMYKQMTNLPPEDVRKYKALAMYNNIKGYL